MKRVKIMLSGILVMAVVAGAMAFNAKKKADFCLFTYQAGPPQACVLSGNAVITTDTEAGTTIGTIVQKLSTQECDDLTPPAVANCQGQIRTTVE